MHTTVKLYSLSFAELRTYLFATIFIIGNIAFPQLAHLIPQGGFIFLPIYFFTLIGAYKYGWKVGLLTAVLSPVVNNILFGMPPIPMLGIIIVKSSLLAIAASVAAKYFGKVSFLGVLSAVLAYQLAGAVIEWGMVKDFWVAIQDFRLGLPGILIQIFAGFALLKSIEKV